MENLDTVITDYKQLKVCEEIAKDKYAPCYVLSQLPLGRYYPIDLALTVNPNTSDNTLDKLFTNCEYFLYKERIEIVASMVRHEHISSDTLSRIIEKYKEEIPILCRIASHPNLLKDDIKKLIDIGCEGISENIAKRKDLDNELCWELFQHGGLKVLYYLGMNWICPIDILEEIVKKFCNNNMSIYDAALLDNKLRFRKGGYKCRS